MNRARDVLAEWLEDNEEWKEDEEVGLSRTTDEAMQNLATLALALYGDDYEVVFAHHCEPTCPLGFDVLLGIGNGFSEVRSYIL